MQITMRIPKIADLPGVSTPGRADWFDAARFGLFVHWGLYTLPARQGGDNGLTEWVRYNERLTDDAYRRYFERFDPDLFDPRAWARAARAAGMRYAVLTAKHHDGFCLFDSALTDFKSTNTPAGRDLVQEFLDAFRAEGLRVGLYYSLLDWHHPDFTLDGLHPQRDDLAARARNVERDFGRYVEYLHGQVRELLTRYGTIDVLWFDFSYAERDYGWSRGKGHEDWHSETLLRLIRELQPDVLVNNRLDLPDFDFTTPEQVQPLVWPEHGGKRVRWEACHTLNGTWGYARDNAEWKSADLLVRLLIDTVSKGGNLLLNVGPDGRGAWPAEATERLGAVGVWARRHERSFRGCTASPFVAPADTRLTQNGHRVYVHLFAWPMGHVHLPDLGGKVDYAQFLHDASEVRFHETFGTSEHNAMETRVPPGTLTLELPSRRPDVLVPVIELFLKEDQ